MVSNLDPVCAIHGKDKDDNPWDVCKGQCAIHAGIEEKVV